MYVKIETRPLTTSQRQRQDLACDSTLSFGIACLSLLWEVSSQWSLRASESEFHRALSPVSSFLAFLWARNGLWPMPKTKKLAMNHILFNTKYFSFRRPKAYGYFV